MSRGAPLPPYIKDQGEEAGGQEEGAPGRSPTPTGSRTPPIQVGVGEEREGERGGKERGAPPALLVQFGLEGEGARGPALATPPLLH